MFIDSNQPSCASDEFFCKNKILSKKTAYFCGFLKLCYYSNSTVPVAFGKSSGRSGNYSTNYQQTGRELLTADEVRLLDNNYGLLFIKREQSIKDKKYDLLKHPNTKQTLDGGRETYIHRQVHHFIDDWQNILLSDNEYELLDQEEAEKYVKEIKKNEES